MRPLIQRFVLLIFILVVISSSLSAQTILWQSTFGGSDLDYASCIAPTDDNGFIIAGGTQSFVTGYHGNGDCWIIKIDSSGTSQWQKALGGSQWDGTTAIEQTDDGGYIMVGNTGSNDGDVNGIIGVRAYWIVKLDDTGTIEWNKALGGSDLEGATDVKQTTDGGYIVSGYARSNNYDVVGNHGVGSDDYWIIKLDTAGTVQWKKALGGSGYEVAYSIEQTNDGGYIVAGNANSIDGDVSSRIGGQDFWVVKLDTSGSISWEKSLGGTDDEFAYSIKQTNDGGYIVAGKSNSSDVDVTSNQGSYDYWVVKLNSTGLIQWQQSLGGSNNDEAHSVYEDSDGNYVVAGWSRSTDGDVTGNQGNYDHWIVKLNSAGDLIWQQSLGGSDEDKADFIAESNDGNIVIAGSSRSSDGDVASNYGASDMWIVKLQDTCYSTSSSISPQTCSSYTSPSGNYTWSSSGTYMDTITNYTGCDSVITINLTVATSISTTIAPVTCGSYTSPSGNYTWASSGTYMDTVPGLGGCDTIITINLILQSVSAPGSPQEIDWQKTFGGSNSEFAYSVEQTTDGGYVVGGYTTSTDGDVTGNHGKSDYWVVKLDAAGSLQWQKALGGSEEEQIRTIQQTTDGGYIVAGHSRSNNGDVTGNNGGYDYWIVKLNSAGTIQWQKSLGGSDDDIAMFIRQTADGGYVTAGYTPSNDGDVTGNHGSHDYWIVKLNSTGTIQWQKSLGGSGFELVHSIQQTSDGGYVVSGVSDSNDGDVTGNHGNRDYWIVKLDDSGNLQWQKSLGGSARESTPSVQQANDGGYLIAGYSLSNDGDVTGNHGGTDTWVVKLDGSGNLLWQKTYGGSDWDHAQFLQQTSDGGYVVAGRSRSTDGDVTGNQGGDDFWILMLDAAGTIQWQKSLGGSGADYAYSIDETTDGYVVGGFTQSTDGDVVGNNGGRDFWVVKLVGYELIDTTVCESYTSPSGIYTWTASGTYSDTLSSVSGCDSFITVNLTINSSSTSTINPTECNSYISPSGNHTWTTSGTYTDTLTNVNSCDSIITINLTINTCGVIWTGTNSHDWFDPGNWSGGFVPGPTDDVTIPDVANDPEILGVTTAQVNGIIIQAGATITIANSAELQIFGDLSNTGTFIGNGSMTFKGGAQSITGSTSFQGTVSVPTGNTLNTNSNLTLLPGANLMHGTGTPQGGGSVNGNITMQQTGHTGGAYNYWSNPVVGPSVGVLGSSVYYYDPNAAISNNTVPDIQAGWTPASGTMGQGIGYAAYNSGTVSFTGTPGNADTGSPINVSITKNAGTGVGVNLLGNPFPSSLDVADFMNVNGPNGNGTIEGTVYIWDDDGSNGSGYTQADFMVWSGAGIVFGPNSSYPFFGYLSTGQGFFIEKTSNGTANIEFRNSMRDVSGNYLFKQAAIERFWISTTNAVDLYNETLIAFIDDATIGHDPLYDSKKMRGSVDIALFTQENGNDYAIQAVPALDLDREIAIGFETSVGGTHSMKLDRFENLDETVTIVLEDRQEGVFQSLNINPEYTFTAQAGAILNRFYIHVSPALEVSSSATGCESDLDGRIQLNQEGNKQWDYTLINALGTTVDTQTGFNGMVDISGLESGMYTLTLKDTYGYEIVKAIQVDALQQASVEFVKNKTTVDTGEEITFTATTQGVNTLTWDLGDGTLLYDVAQATHHYQTPGTYQVSLYGENDDCGMEVSDVVIVEEKTTGIYETDAFAVKVYGYDKQVIVQFSELPQAAEVEIFNTLGQNVYSAASVTDQTYTIDMQNTADGFYLIRVNCEEKIYKGKVLLLD